MRKVVSLVLALFMISAFCSCSIEEKQVQFTLSETDIEMTIGDTKSIEVLGDNVSGVDWSSADQKIATVADGIVRAVGVGSTVISAKSELDERIVKKCNVTVKEKELTGLSLSPSNTTIKVGKTVKLLASPTPSDVTLANLSWSSSNPDVAVVNSEGNVTGVSKGTIIITCKSGSVEATSTVIVEEDNEKKDSSSSKKDSSSESSNAKEVIVVHDGVGYYRPGYVYTASDFVFPNSSSVRLTNYEIGQTLSRMSGYPVSDSFTQDAINEIYARNGYVFKSSNLRSYYNSKPWYYENPSFSINNLSEIEKYNINMLTNYR